MIITLLQVVYVCNQLDVFRGQHRTATTATCPSVSGSNDPHPSSSSARRDGRLPSASKARYIRQHRLQGVYRLNNGCPPTCPPLSTPTRSRRSPLPPPLRIFERGEATAFLFTRVRYSADYTGLSPLKWWNSGCPDGVSTPIHPYAVSPDKYHVQFGKENRLFSA
jgi:hypothetical protein